MKFSTKLSHARIKLRHDFLKLRVQRPLYYKILAMVVLIFALGGILAAYHFYLNNQDPVTLGDQTALEIKTYSINGEVTSVEGTIFQIKTGSVKTSDGSSTVEYTQKTVHVTNTTVINKVKLEPNKVNSSPGAMSDIKTGRLIAVYTSKDPSKSGEIAAEKIEVLE